MTAGAGGGGPVPAEAPRARPRAALSEAQAELAAQRELRERIARRKAEKEGPVAAGAKLSGQAADLLAAVRAVESGAKPAAGVLRRRPGRRPAGAAAAPPRPPRRRPRPRPRRPPPAAGRRDRRGRAGRAGPRAAPPRRWPARPPRPSASGAAEQLREDPWRLLAVPGVRPEQADGFARALLGAECGPDDERRTAALVGWLLEQAALQGHTALEAAALRAALAERAVPDPDGGRAAAPSPRASCWSSRTALGRARSRTPARGGRRGPGGGGGPAGAEPVRVLLGLDRYALAEESLADGLARLVNACRRRAPTGRTAAAAAPSPPPPS